MISAACRAGVRYWNRSGCAALLVSREPLNSAVEFATVTIGGPVTATD